MQDPKVCSGIAVNYYNFKCLTIMQIKLKSNIAVSDNGFVFDPTTGDSYSVNPIGVDIIKWMKTYDKEEDVINQIIEVYDIDSKTVEKDLYDFLNLLQNYQLAEKA